MAGETQQVGGFTANLNYSVPPPAEVRSEGSITGSGSWAVAAGGFLAAAALALLFRGRGRSRIREEAGGLLRLRGPVGRLGGLVPEPIPVRPVLPGGVNPFTALRTAGVTAGTAVAVAGCGDEGGTEVNQPPVIATVQDRTIMAGRSLEFDVTATDPNYHDDMTWKTYYRGPNTNLREGLPSHAQFDVDPCEYNGCRFNNVNSSKGTFRWEPSSAQVGDYEIVFEVSDGEASSRDSINIHVDDPDPYVPPSHPPSYQDACPHVVVTPDGEVFSTWVRRQGGGPALALARGIITSEGIILPVTTSSDDPLLCGAKKALGVAGDGSAEICWQESDASIHCGRFGSNGAAIHSPREVVGDVDLYLAPTGGDLDEEVQRVFSVGMFSDGAFPLTWTREGKVYLRIFSASGYPNTDIIEVGNGDQPDLSVSGDQVTLVWRDDNYHIQFRKYGSDGQILSSPSDPFDGYYPFAQFFFERCRVPSISSQSDGLVAIAVTCSPQVMLSVSNPQGQRISRMSYNTDDLIPGWYVNDIDVAITDEGRVCVGALHAMGHTIYDFRPESIWSGSLSLNDQISYNALPFYDTAFSLGANQNAPVLAYGRRHLQVSGDSPVFFLGLDVFPSTSAISDNPFVSAPASLDFGSVPVGTSATLPYGVTNRGRLPLTLTSSGVSSPFSVPVSLTVPPLSYGSISVSFSPAAVGDFDETVVFTTNDPLHPVVHLSLFGHGET